MDTSPGAAIIISLALAIALATGPAAGAFSFPAGWTTATGLIASVPGPSDNGSASRVRAIDDSYNGKTVHLARGDVLLVQLNEPDPAQAWQSGGEGGFRVVSDAVLERCPARHDFRVKVLGPGDLSFAKIDRRDNFIIANFTVHVVIEEKAPEGKKTTSYPLYGLAAFSPGLDTHRFGRQT